MKTRTGMMMFLIFVAILGIGIGTWMAFGPDEVRLTREHIQTLIDEQLPFERDDITISNATVHFEGNEVIVNVDVAGEKFGQKFSLSAMTVGEPKYKVGSFYFVPSNVEFKDVVVGESEGRSLKDRINDATKRYLPNSEGGRNLVTDLTPRLEAWLQDRTMKAAEMVLSRVPVYTLPNDTKGLVAKAVLGDVFVDNDELVITFTLWRLTWWVLIASLVILTSIGMIGAMIRNPGMFMAISLLPTDF